MNIHIHGTDLLTKVSIYEDGVWATSGALRKAECGYVIDDAPADLGECVYEAIEQAIDDSVAKMRHYHDGEIEHGGKTYAWTAE
jgi:hypothetical protein